MQNKTHKCDRCNTPVRWEPEYYVWVGINSKRIVCPNTRMLHEVSNK